LNDVIFVSMQLPFTALDYCW